MGARDDNPAVTCLDIDLVADMMVNITATEQVIADVLLRLAA